jgi:tRNA(Arg) A34 adenosine deaminase TadA
MPEERFMRQAIDIARAGISAGQTPFGTVIVRDGQVIAAAHNEVWSRTDPTAHAEVLAIRAACEKLGTIDLSGCELYSTTEPCPMCFAAVHWAKIPRIVFGTRIADAISAGFGELEISNEQMKTIGGGHVEIVGDFIADQCAVLFDEWKLADDSRVY